MSLVVLEYQSGVTNGIAVRMQQSFEKRAIYDNHTGNDMLGNKIRTLVGIWMLVVARTALAGGETPVSDGLRYVTNAMYGATGVAIATIAMMVVGLLCLGHFLKWSALGFTIMGISIIFGAGSIVNGIVSLIHHF